MGDRFGGDERTGEDFEEDEIEGVPLEVVAQPWVLQDSSQGLWSECGHSQLASLSLSLLMSYRRWRWRCNDTGL